MVGNSCHSYDVLFRSYLGNSRSRAVNSNPKENLDFEVVPNQLKIGQRVAYGQAVFGTREFFECQNWYGFIAI